MKLLPHCRDFHDTVLSSLRLHSTQNAARRNQHPISFLNTPELTPTTFYIDTLVTELRTFHHASVHG